MKTIRIVDMTLKDSVVRGDMGMSFKEKLGVARELDRLGVYCIECPRIKDMKADGLLVRTLAGVLKNSVLSIPVALSREGVEQAWAAVSGAAEPQLCVSVPVSAAQMEYVSRVKPAAMHKLIGELVSRAKSLCPRVEFSAEDATRAEPEFLIGAVSTAVEAGATVVNISDSAGLMLPTEFSALIERLYGAVPALAGVELSVQCDDELNMAVANAFAAASVGAVRIKASVGGVHSPRLDALAQVLRLRGEVMGLCTSLSMTDFKRCMSKLWFADPKAARGGASAPAAEGERAVPALTAESTRADVLEAVGALGYELSDEDAAKVYEEVQRACAARSIATSELDAIVASVAMAVPPTYKLVDFVITSGSIISSTANIRLERDGEIRQGLSSGDGPIDAAFMALERITGHHYELDDFQIQSVTEGREAMGNALVRLRSAGRLYSGKGVSTDIIAASIRAYVAALNKIVYEEK